MNTDILPIIDKKIKMLSKKSRKAPTEFLEPELRRLFNRDIIRYEIKEEEIEPFLVGTLISLEEEYHYYFKQEEIITSVRPSHWWEFTYAGCNGQIEDFLTRNGFNYIQKLLWETEGGVKEGIKHLEDELSNSSLNPERVCLKQYLISIGYLYPITEEAIKVHPNLLYGQRATETTFRTKDSPFLTRDLIRGPYLDITHNFKTKLTNKERWEYWKDLLALSIARLPEEMIYSLEHFKNKKGRDMDVIIPRLELGRIFMPKRYTKLVPIIEPFDWYIPPTSL